MKKKIPVIPVTPVTPGLRILSGLHWIPVITALVLTACPQPKKKTSVMPTTRSIGYNSQGAGLPVKESPWSTRTVTFARSMKTSPVSVRAEAQNGPGWMLIEGAMGTWKDDRRLLIHTGWGRFPENTTLRFTVNGLHAADSSAVPDHIESFTTSTQEIQFGIADTGQTSCYDGAVARSCPLSLFPGQDAESVPVQRSFTEPSSIAEFPEDQTTTDNVTGHVWKTCSEGQSGTDCREGRPASYNWYGAIVACNHLNSANRGAGYAGRNDWRLPTIAELERLINFGLASPAIDSDFFPGTGTARPYWPLSGYGPNQAYAWAVFFHDGDVTTQNKATTGFVRCISGE